jgi:hypothetical protein
MKVRYGKARCPCRCWIGYCSSRFQAGRFRGNAVLRKGRIKSGRNVGLSPAPLGLYFGEAEQLISVRRPP